VCGKPYWGWIPGAPRGGPGGEAKGFAIRGTSSREGGGGGGAEKRGESGPPAGALKKKTGEVSLSEGHGLQNALDLRIYGRPHRSRVVSHQKKNMSNNETSNQQLRSGV
jgi:hypothetical protein